MRCTRVGRSWNGGEGFILDSHGAAGRGARGPSPLEVEAAEMAGDIHDFANKEETGDFAAFHGFAGKFIGVHTAGGDFGFFITFGSCRSDDPFVNLTLESFERLIRPLGWSVEIEPAHGKTLRENSLQLGAHGRDIPDFALAQGRGDVTAWSQVHSDRFASVPVRRNLQDRGAAQATVSDKHALGEGMRLEGFFADGYDHLYGNTGEVAVVVAVLWTESERDEGGPWCYDFQTELEGEIVTESGGAHFGDGEATGGYHQNGCAEFAGFGEGHEFGAALDFPNFAFGKKLHSRGLTFRVQHIGDFRGGMIAEELAKCFFVVGDMVFFDQGDEIGGRVTRQRGFGEVRVGRKKVFRLAMKVGEIAAAAAGDEDFLADTVSVFEDSDATAAFSGFDGAQQSRRAATKNKHIEFAIHGWNGDGSCFIFQVIFGTAMVSGNRCDPQCSVTR